MYHAQERVIDVPIAETCVGGLRYIGLVRYDADRVLAAASRADEKDLYAAQRDVFLDPAEPVA